VITKLRQLWAQTFQTHKPDLPPAPETEPPPADQMLHNLERTQGLIEEAIVQTWARIPRAVRFVIVDRPVRELQQHYPQDFWIQQYCRLVEVSTVNRKALTLLQLKLQEPAQHTARVAGQRQGGR
jgi:hypothetical protein